MTWVGAEAVRGYHGSIDMLLYSYANTNETHERRKKSSVMNVLSGDIGKGKQRRKPEGRWRPEALLWS